MSNHHLTRALDVLGPAQHAVVTREDLHRHDVPDVDIDRAMARRQLLGLRPGVMGIGGVALDWPSMAYADFRYLERQIRRKRRPGAPMPVVALTGIADLALRGIGDLTPPDTPLLVTNPPSRSRAVFHQYREQLHHGLVEKVRGFTSTILPWSLVEASDVLSTTVMENIVIQLVRDGVVTVAELYAAADALGWSIGGRLRDLLDGLTADDLRTRSGRERRALRAFIAAGLPAPEVNVLLVLAGHRFEMDMLWRALRLILEIDGPHHDLKAQRDRDRRRDRLADEFGFHIERATIEDVDHDLPGLVERMRKLIADRS